LVSDRIYEPKTFFFRKLDKTYVEALVAPHNIDRSPWPIAFISDYCCKQCVITSIYEYCSEAFPPDGARSLDESRPRGSLATEPHRRQVMDRCALPPRRTLNLLVFPGRMGLLHLLQYNRLNRIGLRTLYLSHSLRALRRCLSAREMSFGAISRAAQMRLLTLLAASRFLTLEFPCMGGLPDLT